MKQPLGVRLNNPGNLEWGSPWEGLVPRETSTYYWTGTSQQKRFAQFKDPAFGIRAIALTLITYYDKRSAADGSKIDTVSEAIARWAPSIENNTEAYARSVAKHMGVDPFTRLDFKSYKVMRGMVTGIIAHENAGFAYPAEVIDEGLRRAGVVNQRKSPLNTSVVAGAITPSIAGAATLVPLIEPVTAALRDQQENLGSGSWIRIIVGAVLVACAGAVAYSQYKRWKAGAS